MTETTLDAILRKKCKYIYFHFGDKKEMQIGCFHVGDRYVSCGVHLEWCGVCGVVYTSVKCEHSCWYKIQAGT